MVVKIIVVVVVVSGSGMRRAGGWATVQQAAACQAARLDCETKARRAVVGTARSKQASKQRAQADQMRAD